MSIYLIEHGANFIIGENDGHPTFDDTMMIQIKEYVIQLFLLRITDPEYKLKLAI